MIELRRRVAALIQLVGEGLRVRAQHLIMRAVFFRQVQDDVSYRLVLVLKAGRWARTTR